MFLSHSKTSISSHWVLPLSTPQQKEQNPLARFLRTHTQLLLYIPLASVRKNHLSHWRCPDLKTYAFPLRTHPKKKTKKPKILLINKKETLLHLTIIFINLLDFFEGGEQLSSKHFNLTTKLQ